MNTFHKSFWIATLNRISQNRLVAYLSGCAKIAGLSRIVAGASLGLFINFLLFRLYTLLRLDLGTRFREAVVAFAAGIGNDLLFTACLMLLLYVLTLIAAAIRIPAAIQRVFLYISTSAAIFLTGVLSNLGLEYYRYTKSYLEPEQIGNYWHQIGYFTSSLQSSDFSLMSFAGMTGLWMIVSGLTFVFIRRRAFIEKIAGHIIVAFFIVGAAITYFTPGDYHLAENYISLLLSRSMPRNGAQAAPIAETSFDRCLSRQYIHPDKNHPLFRRAIPQASGTPLVNINERKPNIIMVFMESFSAAYLDRNRQESIKLTPEVEKMIGKGIYFSRFYANGVQTTRGLFSSLCSVYDHFGSQTSTNYPGLRLKCLPGILRQYGYSTQYLQSHDLNFDNMQKSLRIMGFDRLTGFDDLPAALQKVKKVGWGIPDEYLLDYATTVIENSHKRPFMLTIMTLTNHHPFHVPEKKFALYPEDRIENRFRNTIHYADYALGRFIRGLEDKGLLKNTIVIIAADHPQPMKEHNDNVQATVQAFEENFHIPLIIYSPDYIKKAKQYDMIASQVDIIPLMLSLLGIPEGENAFAGQNPLAANACHFAVMSQPYGEGHMVIRYNSWKYEYRQASHQGVFFDLSVDPQEQHPLAIIPDRQLQQDMPAFLLKTVETTKKAIETNSVYPPRKYL